MLGGGCSVRDIACEPRPMTPNRLLTVLRDTTVAGMCMRGVAAACCR